MLDVNREVVYQPFDSFLIVVGTVPTRLSDTIAFAKTDLIDSFVISLDAGAANNIFIGGANVTVNNGVEIVAGGGPVNFVIENQNEHYEILDPLLRISETLQCTPKQPLAIPFIVWDLSQIYLVAAAATNVRVMPFRSMFI